MTSSQNLGSKNSLSSNDSQQDVKIGHSTIKRLANKATKYQKLVSEIQEKLNNALGNSKKGRKNKTTDEKIQRYLDERNKALNKLLTALETLDESTRLPDLVEFAEFFFKNRFTPNLPIIPPQEPLIIDLTSGDNDSEQQIVLHESVPKEKRSLPETSVELQ